MTTFSSSIHAFFALCISTALILHVSERQSWAIDTDLLHLRLDSRSFSPALCQSHGGHHTIRIQAAKRRDLIIRQVPGQFIPPTAGEARTKDYVHYLTLDDLTNGMITSGSIAFDQRHAVIFTPAHPRGLSRQQYIGSLPQAQKTLAETALNTFLRLSPAFHAAIGACRAYPPFTIYGTDEEIERIEHAKKTFSTLIHQFNTDPAAFPASGLPEPGISGGFVDPEAGKGTNISYHSLNPLNFYVPSRVPSRTRCGIVD